ncbi:MAG: PQQ-dependent sugar dehydrogenase [Acidimicrobiia bacterium]|nr:PQQ-dependent sugar dehydrogenase [Acidimicrobiia bacterium]MBP8180386.1 PQQ-dependent sugar dehydrogenase [Acidimicrobiia bacterium]
MVTQTFTRRAGDAGTALWASGTGGAVHQRNGGSTRPTFRVAALALTLIALLGACAEGNSDAATEPSTPRPAECSSATTNKLGLNEEQMSGCRRPFTTSGNEPIATVALNVMAVGTQPTKLGFHPQDDPGAFFFTDNDGIIYRVDPVGNYQIILDIRGQVTNGFEQGLLDVTFDPTGEWMYFSATQLDGSLEIVAVPISSTDWSVDTERARGILSVPQPGDVHNGGAMAFGPDGMLYIGVGDGGDAKVVPPLTPDTVLGKVLRIDPTPAALAPYAIPPDNPAADGTGGRPEMWIQGLRNPWSISFDRDGGIWIADVGSDVFEEINYLPADGQAGAHLGWNAVMGYQPNNAKGTPLHEPITPPIHVYAHIPESVRPDGSVDWERVKQGGDENADCSIIGGFVYEGTAFAQLDGAYLFSDYCSSQLRALFVEPDGSTRVETLAIWEDSPTLATPTDIAEGPNGEPLIATYYGAIKSMIPIQAHPAARDDLDALRPTDPVNPDKLVSLQQGDLDIAKLAR